MANSDRPETKRRSDQLVAAGLVALVASVKRLRKEAGRVSSLVFRTQEDAKFCHDLLTVMHAIQDGFTTWGWAESLKSFPLLQIPQRWDLGYDLRKADLLPQLERTIRLLTEQLKLVDLRSFLAAADNAQVGDLLKATRERKGDKQSAAAEALDVTVDSVKGWESGRQHPRGENLSKLAAYITSAFSDTRS